MSTATKKLLKCGATLAVYAFGVWLLWPYGWRPIVAAFVILTAHHLEKHAE